MKTMLDYINEIPEYIKTHNESGDFLKLKKDYIKENKKSLTIVASGSSNNASSVAYFYLISKLNVDVNIFTPYTFNNYERIDKESFYVVISQSGRSINTLKVIEKLRNENITVHFITDNKEIKDEDNLKVYQLDDGNEEVPFVTKGMSSTIFFLLKFADSNFVNVDEFEKYFKEYQNKANVFFENNKDKLLNTKRVHILGSGPSLAVAREGSLKFQETLHVAASPYEIEEFLHGGNFELQKDHYVFIVNSNDCENKRIEQLKQNINILCDNLFVLERVSFDESISCLVYLAFFQTLVYLINKEKGNSIPMMEDKYLEFESKLKAKTINYYE